MMGLVGSVFLLFLVFFVVFFFVCVPLKSRVSGMAILACPFGFL